jgi:ribosomal protein S6--L-glutamate ligase
MKIGMIMVRHPAERISPILPEIMRLLTEWGATVDTIYPEERLIDLATVRVEHDLYILKAKTDVALSFAGALHAVGARIFNPYPVTAIMRDKIITSRILQAAGVPTPDTYVAAHLQHLRPLLAAGPLVVKPYRGSQGQGVHVVHTVAQLDTIAHEHGPIFAQRYHSPQGRDRKIYCIGDQIFGVERVWPPRTYQDKLGRPFTVSAEERDITRRCGQAFGLDLYGLDVVISDGRPYVVDISSFPGFKGVPDAALRLADHIYYTAGQQMVQREQLPTPIAEISV